MAACCSFSASAERRRTALFAASAFRSVQMTLVTVETDYRERTSVVTVCNNVDNCSYVSNSDDDDSDTGVSCGAAAH
jgi:hypothetical protein